MHDTITSRQAITILSQLYYTLSSLYQENMRMTLLFVSGIAIGARVMDDEGEDEGAEPGDYVLNGT
jgi:hypothetical protein